MRERHVRYAFEKIEVEPTSAGKANVYVNWANSPEDCSIEIKAKNWFERVTSSSSTKDIPNIVLRKSRFRGFKIVVVRDSGAYYGCTLVSWMIPFAAGSESMQASKQILLNLIQEATELGH